MKKFKITIQNRCDHYIRTLISTLGSGFQNRDYNDDWCKDCRFKNTETCKRAQMGYRVGYNLNEKDPIVIYEGPDKDLAFSFYNKEYDFSTELNIKSDILSRYNKSSHKFIVSGTLVDSKQKAVDLILLFTKLLTVENFRGFSNEAKSIVKLFDIVRKNEKLKGIIPTSNHFDIMSKYNYGIKFHSCDISDWEIYFYPSDKASSNTSYIITPEGKDNSKTLSELVEMTDLFYHCYLHSDDFDAYVKLIYNLFNSANRFEITKHQNS